ncbi:hypothetical protein HDU98_011313 [Podochytrium sp. JEL0797]|nr:hypothetical protein HDU98_011313 [Podochytrium sp. JEL0797]
MSNVVGSLLNLTSAANPMGGAINGLLNPLNGNGSIVPAVPSNVTDIVHTITANNGILGAVAIGVGFYFLILGFKLYKPTLFLMGFVAGAIAGYSGLMHFRPPEGYPSDSNVVMYGSAAVGLMGGALLLCLIKLGLAIIGCLGGLFLGLSSLSFNLLGPLETGTPRTIYLISLCVVGVAIAFFLEKHVVIVATSVVGGYAVVFGVDCFAGTGFQKANLSQNLYIFGAPYGDINLGGSSSSWTSATAPTSPNLLTNIANRPPFNTANPTCSFAPFLNYITVLNGDKALGVSALHVFDVVAQTWSVVKVTGADVPDAGDVVATLDHDTNVIYAYSKGSIYRIGDADLINLSQLSSNPSLKLKWLANPVINEQPFDGTDYIPVFGQGTNHLHFLNAPGLAAGQAWIFVVHYAWWQPTPQTYGSFPPSTGGQTVSIPALDQTKAPSVFAYFPDDGTASYLIDTVANATTTIAGFGKSGNSFRYSATSRNIVQMDTRTGDLQVLAVAGGGVTAGTGVTLLQTVAEGPVGSLSVSSVGTKGGVVATATTAANVAAPSVGGQSVASVVAATTATRVMDVTNDGNISQNLYIFGAPYGDINLGGSSSSWTSATAPTSPNLLTNIANRPPFNTANPICSFAPFLNYITVLNGDQSKGLSVMHVFDTKAQTWTIVPIANSTSGKMPSVTDLAATLDHDTNVMYAYSSGAIFRIGDANLINLSQLSTNPALNLSWISDIQVTPQPFDGKDYKPVFGQGTNHLHFLNAPGLAAGQAWIFVVHYAWWQPTPQTFGSFPTSTGGQTVYIPALDQSKAPAVFAYFPDDGSATYLIDTVSNTTTTITGFGKSGPTFRYSATSGNIVQMDTKTGDLQVLAVAGGGVTAGTGVALLPTASVVATGTVVVSSPTGVSATGVATSKSGAAGLVAGVLAMDPQPKKYKVVPKGQSTGGDGGAAGIRKKIRDAERLLRRPKLPATTKQELERRIKSLNKELVNKAREVNETDISGKYKFVKHLERKKVLKNITRLEKSVAELTAEGQDASSTSEDLAQQRIRLAYIEFYPKDMKYISLFPTTSTTDESQTAATAPPAKKKRKAAAADDSLSSDNLRDLILSGVEKAIASGEAKKDNFALRLRDVLVDEEQVALYLAQSGLGKKSKTLIRAEVAVEKVESQKKGGAADKKLEAKVKVDKKVTKKAAEQEEDDDDEENEDGEDDFFLTGDDDGTDAKYAEVIEPEDFYVERAVKQKKGPKDAAFKAQPKKGKIRI